MKKTIATRIPHTREVKFELHAKVGKIELLKDIQIDCFCIYNGKIFIYYPGGDEKALLDFQELTR